MYVVTFYSFKGGTGRTMALVNVGVALASRGRRVLMVDFDLEAPGLDTFRFMRPQGEPPGVVDYIRAYLASGTAPDVKDYVYDVSPFEQESGRMWIMRAGKQDQQYDLRFKSLDWEDLYRSRAGFLLFEDLKAQWEKSLQPDYVLIDSRTGHTDVGGICTRQLPDAVVVLFFPNEQNRRGLKTIVDEIRGEASGPLNKVIHLHFVMANVPDLDDEQEILADNVLRLQHTLQYNRLEATIHHYNSLALLNQTVFVLERPRSRLAQEYRQLTTAIVRQNLQDREGAVAFLDDVLRRIRTRAVSSSTEKQLEQIKALHSGEVEVVRRLARLRRRQRKTEEALLLLDQAISAGLEDSEIFLSRAELSAAGGKAEDALADLQRLLRLRDVPAFELTVVARMLMELSPQSVGLLLQSPAVSHLDSDGQVQLARELEGGVATLSVAESTLKGWLESHPSGDGADAVRSELVLCLIGQGRFSEAAGLISSARPNPDALDIYDAFNYAMAEWGETSKVPIDMLERVLSIHLQRASTSSPLTNPNYCQCIAIAFWAVGRLPEAFESSRNAFDSMERQLYRSFSAWSYLTVPPKRFLDDLSAMDRMFSGEDVVPEFIRRASAARTV